MSIVYISASIEFLPYPFLSSVLISAAKRMEDLLQNIIKDAAGKQNQNLKQAAQIAYGKLSEYCSYREN